MESARPKSRIGAGHVTATRRATQCRPLGHLRLNLRIKKRRIKFANAHILQQRSEKPNSNPSMYRNHVVNAETDGLEAFLRLEAVENVAEP